MPHPRKEGLYMIAYVGIDAHTTNYTLSTYLEGSAAPVNTNTYSPSVSNIVNYCKGIRKKIGNDTEIIVGYEAGCLGFKLKRDLESNGLTTKILAPASITGTEINRRCRKKTDKRDAEAIARSLKNHEYSEVYTPPMKKMNQYVISSVCSSITRSSSK